MFKLDDALLQEVGLGPLPATAKNSLLRQCYSELQMRVGGMLARAMTDEQLCEFEVFIDREDEAGALAWLTENFPHYRDIVGEELEALKDELAQNAPRVLAAFAVGTDR